MEVSEAVRASVVGKNEPPKTILVKWRSGRPYEGVPLVPRNQRELERKHLNEAIALGVDPHHYRASTVDTGYRVHNNESAVRLGEFLGQLEQAGYRPTGIHYSEDDNRRCHNALTFTLVDDDTTVESITVPEVVMKALKERRYSLTLWVNPKPDGTRLVAINLLNGEDTDKPGRKLQLEERFSLVD